MIQVLLALLLMCPLTGEGERHTMTVKKYQCEGVVLETLTREYQKYPLFYIINGITYVDRDEQGRKAVFYDR